MNRHQIHRFTERDPAAFVFLQDSPIQNSDQRNRVIGPNELKGASLDTVKSLVGSRSVNHMKNKPTGNTTTTVPAEKGTVPIPEGQVRIYHYTRADPQVVREQGLLMRHAKGSTYGEPNIIWGATKPPEPHHTIVEFHVPVSDLTADAERPPSPDKLADWQQGYHHATLRRDVLPHEIIAVHEPWHDRYRYIKSHSDTLQDVLTGQHDDLLSDREYGPAIRQIKVEHSPATNADEIQSCDSQGGKWITISNNPNHLEHRLDSAPDDYDIVGKGKKPTSPIFPPERAVVGHLTQEEIKHQDILHHHQHKLLQKINSGKASHEEHQRFSQIRERLNELHHLASRRQEDKELYDQFMEDSAAQQQAEWERAKRADELSPADLAEKKLRDKHKRAEDKLRAKRAKELRDHFDA